MGRSSSQVLLHCLLSAGVVAITVWVLSTEVTPASSDLLLANPVAGLFAIFAFFLSALCAVRRWQLLLAVHLLNVPFRQLAGSWFKSTFLSGPLALFPCWNIIRDAARVVSLRGGVEIRCCSLSALVHEKLAALLSFLLLNLPAIALISLLSGYPVARARYLLYIFILALLCAGFALFFSRASLFRALVSVCPMPVYVKDWLCVWGTTLLAFPTRPKILIPILGWGALGQILFGAGLFILMLSWAPAPWTSWIHGSIWLDDSAIPLRWISGYLHIFHVADLQASGTEPLFAPESMRTISWCVVGFSWCLGLLLFLFQRGLGLQIVAQSIGPLALLPAERISETRHTIRDIISGAALGGLVAGAISGLLESSWAYYWYLGLSPELRMFWWSALVYGVIFGISGAIFGGFLVWVCLGFDRTRTAGQAFAISMAATIAMNLLVIGRYRFTRAMLEEGLMSPTQIALLFLAAALAFVIVERTLAMTLGALRVRLPRLAAGTLAVWIALILGGAAWGSTHRKVPMRPAYTPDTTAAHRPNIIFVVADTLRADVLPFYNANTPIETPALSEFVLESTLFRNSHAQAPWTKPSFSTMFTGLYPDDHNNGSKISILSEDAHTMAEILQESGYYTQGFPNNRHMLATGGMGQGFIGYDFLMPRLYFGATLSVEQLSLYQALRRLKLWWMAPYTDRDHVYQPAPVVTERAIDWLEHRPIDSDAPFFLYLHYMDNHDPYMSASEPGVGFAASLMGRHPDANRYLEPAKSAYLDEVRYLDSGMAPLFSYLKDRNLFDSSVIVFTSDHGEEFFEHGGWWHGPTLYEEVLHVPIVVKFPHGVAAGEVSDGMARHVDLLPTILLHAGIQIDEALPGVALVEKNGAFANEQTTPTLAETDFLDIRAESVQQGHHKLIVSNPGNTRGLAERELYDLQTDPLETTNLISGEQGLGNKLQALLRMKK